MSDKSDRLAFVTTTRGEDDSLHRLLTDWNRVKSQDTDAQFIVVFNSCEEEYIEGILEEFPLICPIDQDLNPERYTESINHALRFAHSKFWNACILHPGAEQQKDLDTQFEFHPLSQLIYWGVMNSVGYLSPNYAQSHFWMDYALRAKIRGLEYYPKLSPELVEQELSSLSHWDIIKFGTCWVGDATIAPVDFWNFCNSQEWEWHKEMYVK